jgi:hypothetical protein
MADTRLVMLSLVAMDDFDIQKLRDVNKSMLGDVVFIVKFNKDVD